jgi:hypothetical protein
MFFRAMLMVAGMSVGFVARAQQPLAVPPVFLRDAHLIDGTGAPAREHGLRPMQAITAATGANAKLLHLADRGTIAVGACADFWYWMRIRWWIFAIRGRLQRCITMGEVLRNYRGDRGNETSCVRIKNNGERF